MIYEPSIEYGCLVDGRFYWADGGIAGVVNRLHGSKLEPTSLAPPLTS
jgi:hypothetical protein